jgi:hypothetical protein
VNSFAFCFYRNVARFIGSIFFPLFSAWGEDEFCKEKKQVIFARYHGFIAILNLLRFFKSPVAICVKKSMVKEFWWSVLTAGGLQIYVIDEPAGCSDIVAEIEKIFASGLTPVYLVAEKASLSKVEHELAELYSYDRLLFLGMSGCQNCWQFGFIPVVRDMKLFCGSIPLFGKAQKDFNEIDHLNFIENALDLTSQFDLPTFFFTHQKFLKQPD